ncbi:MAG TPA: arginine--tRNA ligase [Saprospiraceae bacterium]|nr:arginine--tRNA ligase [Saprospiraceae bacterium]
MNLLHSIAQSFAEGVFKLYNQEVDAHEVLINPTKKEFEGDFTIVVFPYSKPAGKAPAVIGEELGQHLVKNSNYVDRYNVVNGFLNLSVNNVFWWECLNTMHQSPSYGISEKNGHKVLVEFSSPNTNKPLHLGHIRNILLGWSVTSILEACGYEVIKTQVINDRGIAICKSMLSWVKFGGGVTPAEAGIKSDHFVGNYYVIFENKFQEEYKTWQESESGQQLLKEKGIEEENAASFFKEYKNQYFNLYSTLGKEAREMLQQWEAGDPAVIALWTKMNDWVYQGFESTYKNLGVSFDKNYYESETYLLGKETVAIGLEKGVFQKEDDNSVWIDLTDVGMDRKIVLRSDGTSVYITQDIGTAMLRYKDFGTEKMIYTVADEQDYHFKVLFEILKRLKEPYADGLYHLNYGMVDLTTGKMKSREGTVVDADDLMAEVIEEAAAGSSERGELANLSKAEQEAIITKIGMAALKFFILKVQPRKRMTFDPKESLDMQGQTGPYIQNAYVRIQSIFRKGGSFSLLNQSIQETLEPSEKSLLTLLYSFPDVVQEAGKTYDPSHLANFCYVLAKEFHRFYHEVRILGAATEEEKAFRLGICQMTAIVLEKGMKMLGIEMPDRM